MNSLGRLQKYPPKIQMFFHMPSRQDLQSVLTPKELVRYEVMQAPHTFMSQWLQARSCDVYLPHRPHSSLDVVMCSMICCCPVLGSTANSYSIIVSESGVLMIFLPVLIASPISLPESSSVKVLSASTSIGLLVPNVPILLSCLLLMLPSSLNLEVAKAFSQTPRWVQLWRHFFLDRLRSYFQLFLQSCVFRIACVTDQSACRSLGSARGTDFLSAPASTGLDVIIVFHRLIT